MPRIISVIAQKGGVGKTTSTVHLAMALGNLGFKVLILDWDTSQGNTTFSVIGNINHKTSVGICDVIANGGSIDNIIRKTHNPNVDIIPSEIYDSLGRSYNIETVLNQLGLEGYTLLRNLFAESTQLQDYQFVLIDNTPKLGIETASALIASDYFLIPIHMSDFALDSIGKTIKNALMIKKQSNQKLEPLGMLITSIDQRIALSKKSLIELEQYAKEIGIPLFNAKIPVSSKFAFLPHDMKTIFDVTKKTERGHKEYLELTKEVLSRMQAIERSENHKTEAGVQA
jgi:chromosome partitioning protein